MQRTAWGIALALAIFAGAWLYRGDSELAPGAHLANARDETHDAQRQGAQIASRIAPGVPGSKTSAANAPRLSPLMREFKTSSSYKAIYDRVASSTARSAEETWMLAELLERCATRENSRSSPISPAEHAEESLKSFSAALSPNDPARDKRIAAFERVRADRCAGLHDLKTTNAAIAELRNAAAVAGDPKARVAVLTRELQEAINGKSYAARNISDAQVGALRQLMASGDPDAIQRAASLMQWTFTNFSLRAGPEEAAVDQQIFSNAWTLVACDLGALCGPEGEYLANMCVNQGHCDASSVRDYMFYYMNSPYRSQLLARYYEGARAASGGDWSYFTSARGPTPSQAMWIYPRSEAAK